MNAFERLRYVARTSDDDATVAYEAALALAQMSDDPRALVMSCRRLLEAHALCAPLWSVVARVLGSSEPRTAARRVARRLSEDPTEMALALALPERVEVALRPSALTLGVLVARDDIVVHLVGDSYELHRALRVLPEETEFETYGFGETDVAVANCDLVLVEPVAAAEVSLLVDHRASSLLAAASRARRPIDVVLSEGRLLPRELFDAIERASRASVGASEDEAAFSLVPWSVAELVVDAAGTSPAAGPHRSDIVAPPELASFLPAAR